MSRTSADAMGSPSEEQDCGECYKNMLPEGQDAACERLKPKPEMNPYIYFCLSIVCI